MGRKPSSGVRRRQYNLSFNPEIMETFRELCEKSNTSLSRTFESLADTFLSSMRPGEKLSQQLSLMTTLYFNFRRDNYDVPDVISEIDDS